MPASANAPAPMRKLVVVLENLNDDYAYVDILIALPENDPNYVFINSAYCELLNLNAKSEIVQYQEDGYRSYTFHFKDAASENAISMDMHWGAYASRFAYENNQFGELKKYEKYGFFACGLVAKCVGSVSDVKLPQSK